MTWPLITVTCDVCTPGRWSPGSSPFLELAYSLSICMQFHAIRESSHSIARGVMMESCWPARGVRAYS